MAAVTNRGTLPAGFLGMLGIVVLVEAIVASRPISFSNVASLNRRFSVEAAQKQAPGRDILFFGDSLIKVGLVPAVFEERTGRSAFNLASASGPAPASYVAFRRALAAGARPSCVVVDFGAGLLAASPERDVRNSSEVLNPAEILELAWNARSFPLMASLAMRSVLPSVRRREEIRAGLSASWRGESHREIETNRACLRNWLVNEGAHLAAANPADRSEEVAVAPGSSAPGRLHASRVHRDYVERFFDLAASRGIRVFWLLPPESPSSRASRKRQGVEKSYTELARALMAKHPEVTILDARQSDYDHSLFFDPVHLNVRGAVALSATVADQIADSSGRTTRGERWITLPAPIAPAPGQLPEDFDQSRMVLRQDELSGRTSRK